MKLRLKAVRAKSWIMNGCCPYLRLLIFLTVLPLSRTGEIYAQTTNSFYVDSIPNFRIGEVTVTGNHSDPEGSSSTPLQLLDKNSIQEINSLQVSDAVKFFSGVTVKDYGGLGGMKTVSVRGMGAQHTAVSYDGITITDCQTGQIDIGRYSLDNVDILSLNIGDGNTIFQPARMFALSGLLSIQTKYPVFKEGECFHGKVGLKAGSFGMIEPNFLLETRLNSLFDINLSAEALIYSGNYPYKLYYASDADSYTKEIRSNNNVKTYKIESNLFGHFRKGQQLEVKTYYYQSDRGLPGAVILYNPYSSEHLWDKNAFMQAHYEQNLSPKMVYQLNGKYNWSHERYLNPDYLGSTGKEDYSYTQNETYFSSSLLYNAFQKLSFAFSADGFVNRMTANLYDFVSPSRYSGLTNLSVKYVNSWMFATAGFLATGIHEKTETASAGADYKHISPAFNLSVKPFSIMDFHVRIFYKGSFRMPSFNDLYYSAIGNSSLKPENSKQLNFGLTYSHSFDEGRSQFMFSSDVYHNQITDRITAVPTKNIFIWSMMNLGKVDIKGLDLAFEATKIINKDFKLSFGLNHSYQRALDVTDPLSKVYNNQIAYMPRTSGSGRMAVETPWVKLAYSLLYSGHRYVTGQNLSENNLPGYWDHSVSAEHGFIIHGLNLNLRAEVLNLTDKNYEVVRNFPMPGRSYRFGMEVAF